MKLYKFTKIVLINKTNIVNRLEIILIDIFSIISNKILLFNYNVEKDNPENIINELKDENICIVNEKELKLCLRVYNKVNPRISLIEV